MKSLRFLIVAGLLTAIGATTSAATALGESIAYATGGCFGTCPIYKVTVNRDGTGLFEGRRFTAVRGERAFRLTPTQFAAFARHLAPLRPASGEMIYSGGMCGGMARDLPSADVRWRSSSGVEQHLYFDYGCGRERNSAIAERLSNAPDLLPIRELIGRNR